MTTTGHEPWIRLGMFLGVFLSMALWEWWWPRRGTILGRRRWPANLGLTLLGTLIVRLLFPAGAVGVAVVASRAGWGLLGWTSWPAWFEDLVAVVLLDAVIYFQHVLFHAVPALWRLHQVHHADVDVDVTTGARFHPVEILLSMLLKYGAVAALGASPRAVLIFEVLLNATAMFNHANVAIPSRIERWLRWFVVTPDMHRVHHSIHPDETNSNFGFNLPWWDRLFGTYRAQPRDGHQRMVLGLERFRAPEDQRLSSLLVLPLWGKAAGYAFDERKRAETKSEA